MSTDAETRESDLCVSRVPLFQGLSYEEQLDVAGVAQPTKKSRSESLYTTGSSISQLMVVHTGYVKISRTTADGHEQIIRVLGPGDFIGESAFLTGARPDHSATALEPAELCVFRHRDLGKLVAKHPSIALRMLQGVSQRLQQAENRLEAVISGDVSSRLADYLLDLPAQRADDGNLTVRLPLAKKDIASLLDTSPESLSRQLRSLTEAGIISQTPKTVTFLDLDRLLALSKQN
ncbi:Crp/Fnr family transcriptional regulator [Flaviflexus ciconiae]|uniref:Crp/Fnr family transcriptional regulator n=1 Tax=Flaviflexus ciconiae TaxID=2496867 RepID=A0A3S9PZ55_9ACTO|nr:Crp/Fnr family transcriptional regulator [Flaviflexus ciconiae]AZQ77576.1 Crp/Fnr family transcriptional regulator [Flaviflexus ciconiae]